MDSIEIKDIPLREISGSQGFFVPIQYLEERLEGGLKIGQRYDLTIRGREE
jgi:hypothetical protein